MSIMFEKRSPGHYLVVTGDSQFSHAGVVIQVGPEWVAKSMDAWVIGYGRTRREAASLLVK